MNYVCNGFEVKNIGDYGGEAAFVLLDAPLQYRKYIVAEQCPSTMQVKFESGSYPYNIIMNLKGALDFMFTKYDLDGRRAARKALLPPAESAE